MQPFYLFLTLITVSHQKGKERCTLFKQVRLVKEAQKGDHEAFITLVVGYESVLYNLAYRYLENEVDVADALQETLMNAFEHINEIKQPRYFNTWICRILINQCHKILKNRQFYAELDNVDVADNQSDTSLFIFQDLVNQLDERYSVPLVLYYYHGFTIQDISNLLNEPVGTIKSKLSRGRKQMKETQGGLRDE